MNGDVHQKCLKAFVQNVGKGFDIALGAALAEFQRLTTIRQHESAEVSKLDDLIAHHDGWAGQFPISRDTAEALRLCRDVAVKALKCEEWLATAPEPGDINESIERWVKKNTELVNARTAALAALRDAGMIDPPKPARVVEYCDCGEELNSDWECPAGHGKPAPEQGQRGGE